MTRDDELEVLLSIARDAADIVSAVYATDFAVELKGPDDPVTRADREANTFICAELASRFPADAVIAEESAPDDRAALAKLLERPRVFFVDPLDGTREFADKNGEFAVMIGLCDRSGPIVGVVVAPATGDAFAGRIGVGAFVERAGRREALSVSPEQDPTATRLVVSRSHRPKLVDPFLGYLGASRVLPCGSVGLKAALVASGKAELYVHGGIGAKRWDTAGPEAILRAAGGKFTDLDGAPIDYRDPDLMVRNGMIVSNGLLHDAALRAIVALRRDHPGVG